MPDMFIHNFDDMKVKFLGARTGKSGGFLAEDHRENLQGKRTRKSFPQGEQEPELLVERRVRAAPGGDSQEEEISKES